MDMMSSIVDMYPFRKYGSPSRQSASALEARLRTALPDCRNGVLGSATTAAAACLKHEQVTAKKYMSH